jgi:hypothetical protein
MRRIAALFVMVTAACEPASSEQIRGPDGTMHWYSVECRRSQSNCYEEAADRCPHGYEVADQGGHSGTSVSTNSNRWASTTVVTPTYNGHMLIRCK